MTVYTEIVWRPLFVEQPALAQVPNLHMHLEGVIRSFRAGISCGAAHRTTSGSSVVVFGLI
jgi:hypothetical protein